MERLQTAGLLRDSECTLNAVFRTLKLRTCWQGDGRATCRDGQHCCMAGGVPDTRRAYGPTGVPYRTARVRAGNDAALRRQARAVLQFLSAERGQRLPPMGGKLLAYAVMLATIVWTSTWVVIGLFIGIICCFGSRILFAHLVGAPAAIVLCLSHPHHQRCAWAPSCSIRSPGSSSGGPV